MKTSRILILALFCLSSIIVQAQSNDKATLYIVRTSSVGSAINFKYFIDDYFVGKANYGKYFKLEVNPGEHLIWAKSENRSFVEATLEGGKTYVLDARGQMGAFKAGVFLKAINNPTEKEMGKINKYILKKKLVNYDENKRKLEQNDYAGFIKKSLAYYTQKVKGSFDIQKLTQSIEIQ